MLLVGDIDRGGVFAQLYGTVALLEPEERQRIKGTVVNKFRGDRKILEPGIRILEDLCAVPVAGVIPYVHADIDDEDSLSQRFSRDTGRKEIDLAVIRLPRIPISQIWGLLNDMKTYPCGMWKNLRNCGIRI